MRRRDFLNTIAALGGVGAFSRLFAFEPAYVNPDRFMLFIYMNGGWDTTLSLDPWLDKIRPDESQIFLEYNPDEIVAANNVFLGPASAAMLPFTSDICVVNGMFMTSEDSGHGPGYQQIVTGDASPNSAHVGIEMTLATPPTPFGFLTNMPVPTASRSSIISTYSEMLRIIDIKNPVEQMAALVKVGKGKSDLFSAMKSIMSSTAEFETLVSLLKSVKEKGKITDPELLKCAFLSGGCTVATYQFYDQSLLDTHGSHPENHLRNLTSHWGKVAEIFNLFKSTPFGQGGESLFDRTTFYVFSEFSRLPFLNEGMGKDHNPFTNSVLLAGRGIRGGQTIGMSKFIPRAQSQTGLSYQIAMPFDFAAQKAVDSPLVNTFLGPENILRTLAELMDVDWTNFGNIPKSTPLLTAALKSV